VYILKQVEIDIEVINREIVEETISIGYGYIRTYAQVQSDLQEEIDHLRAEVVKKTEEKKKYEQQMTHLYTYLHSVIGYEQISKVDRKLWKK
jgi:proline dehydrogenase